jgi:hypothetical protein
MEMLILAMLGVWSNLKKDLTETPREPPPSDTERARRDGSPAMLLRASLVRLGNLSATAAPLVTL